MHVLGHGCHADRPRVPDGGLPCRGGCRGHDHQRSRHRRRDHTDRHEGAHRPDRPGGGRADRRPLSQRLRACGGKHHSCRRGRGLPGPGDRERHRRTGGKRGSRADRDDLIVHLRHRYRHQDDEPRGDLTTGLALRRYEHASHPADRRRERLRPRERDPLSRCDHPVRYVRARDHDAGDGRPPAET